MSKKLKIILIVVIVLAIITAAIVVNRKKQKRLEELETERKGKIRWFTSQYNLGALWYYSQNPQEYNQFAERLPQLELPKFSQGVSDSYFEEKSNLDHAKWAFRHYTKQAISNKVTIAEQIINEANYSLREKLTKEEQQALLIENTISVMPESLPFS